MNRISAPHRAHIAVAACLFLVATLVQVLGPARAGARTAFPSVLTAGHHLVAGTDHDTIASPSQEFQLSVSPTYVELIQFAPLTGPRGGDYTSTGLWFRDDRGMHPNSGHSVLRLTKRGNLQLKTARGVLLWASHTHAGARSRLVVRNSGNVVLYNGRGRYVWSTHTTAVLVPAGSKIASGQRLQFRWASQESGPKRFTSLTMQRDGDLVYRCNSSVDWSSHTHLRHAYAAVTRQGNLAIRAPSGRTVWSTHVRGGDSYTWLDASAMQIKPNRDAKPLWSARIPWDAPC